MITFTQKGSFDNSERWLRRVKSLDFSSLLSKYGEMGVAALSNATPVDSGLTAQSWSYKVEVREGYFSIRWYNTNAEYGKPVAILLQYGHGTGTGGYVAGRDYINPAIRPIFDQIEAEIMREVNK
jgi:hypothetical protein